MPVRQLAERCWILGAEGREFEPHFDSEADARMYASDGEPETLATIRALAEPCWTAVCDGTRAGGPFGTCNEEFQDDEGGNHGGSRAETERWITACGWKITRNGRTFGPCCADEMPPGEEAVSRGQLVLVDLEAAAGAR